MTLTREQCRAARALLDWSQADLASAAGTGLSTVARFERGDLKTYASTLETLRTTLETAGIEFIPENGGGPGLRLKKARGQ